MSVLPSVCLNYRQPWNLYRPGNRRMSSPLDHDQDETQGLHCNNLRCRVLLPSPGSRIGWATYCRYERNHGPFRSNILKHFDNLALFQSSPLWTMWRRGSASRSLPSLPGETQSQSSAIQPIVVNCNRYNYNYICPPLSSTYCSLLRPTWGHLLPLALALKVKGRYVIM